MKQILLDVSGSQIFLEAQAARARALHCSSRHACNAMEPVMDPDTLVNGRVPAAQQGFFKFHTCLPADFQVRIGLHALPD